MYWPTDTYFIFLFLFYWFDPGIWYESRSYHALGQLVVFTAHRIIALYCAQVNFFRLFSTLISTYWWTRENLEFPDNWHFYWLTVVPKGVQLSGYNCTSFFCIKFFAFVKSFLHLYKVFWFKSNAPTKKIVKSFLFLSKVFRSWGVFGS